MTFETYVKIEKEPFDAEIPAGTSAFKRYTFRGNILQKRKYSNKENYNCTRNLSSSKRV